MELDSDIKFSRDQLKSIFPFYFELDGNLEMIAYGPSFKKIWSVKENLTLNKDFFIQRPFIENISFSALLENLNEIFVFENKKEKSLLKGALVYVESRNSILFLGSPFLETFDSLSDKKILVTDFSINDVTFDMLHIIKNKQS